MLNNYLFNPFTKIILIRIIYVIILILFSLYIVNSDPLLCEDYNNEDIFQSNYLYKSKNYSVEYMSAKYIENDTAHFNNYCSKIKSKLSWSLWDLKVCKNTISWILNRRNPDKARVFKRPKHFTPIFSNFRK